MCCKAGGSRDHKEARDDGGAHYGVDDYNGHISNFCGGKILKRISNALLPLETYETKVAEEDEVCTDLIKRKWKN